MTATARCKPATGRFWADLADSLRNPGFWAFASWLDILVRARRSRLGLLWLLAPSIVYVYGLGSFFASMRGKDMIEFAPHVALGAMVFRTLMSTVIGSSGVFVASHSFIMDGNVRLTDYLMQSLAKAFFDMCMYFPVVLLALALAPQVHVLGLLQAPFWVMLIYVNALWISVVFSLIGARFNDFSQLLGNVSIFIFLLTPIIWEVDMMPAETVRGQLMRINPFFHFVELFRAPILGDAVELTSYLYVTAFTLSGLMLATLLYRRYSRFVPLWI